MFENGLGAQITEIDQKWTKITTAPLDLQKRAKCPTDCAQPQRDFQFYPPPLRWCGAPRPFPTRFSNLECSLLFPSRTRTIGLHVCIVLQVGTWHIVRTINITLIPLEVAYEIHRCSSTRSPCYVEFFFCELRGLAWAIGSYSISPPARGTF